MNIKNKYKDNYILLAGLRQYVENGVMLASVNFYRDSVKNYPEFDVIKNRSEILKNNASFLSSNFLVAFVEEDFPKIEDNIPENIIEIAMSIIEMQEDKETATLTKQFLIEYAVCIAKASKEDWLSFIGIKDAISDSEAKFIKKLEKLFVTIN
jgi:hypothetical protein